MPPDETPTKVYASGFWGSFWENDQPFRSIRARFSAPTFCSVSDSDIGNTFPFAQHTRTSEIPAPSIASKTAGRSFEDGVGRNWLSMITATLALPASSSANVGPSTGSESARREASVASPTGPGSSGCTTATRFEVGISTSSVSRCFFDPSSVAPIASGSIDSYGTTTRVVSLIGASRGRSH